MNIKNIYYDSGLDRKVPDDEEIGRTNTIIEKLNLTKGKDLTLIYNRSDVTLLAE